MKPVRILAAAAAAFVIVVGLFAGPASAKIAVERVEITGPGLDDRVSLIEEDAWQFLMGDWSAHLHAAAPAGALGPAYSVEVFIMDRANDVMPFYPFTADGAWLKVPAGSGIAFMLGEDGDPKASGWLRVTASQVAVAERHGFPEAPQEETAAPAIPSIPSVPAVPVATTPARTGLPVGLGLAALGSLLVAGAVMERRALKRRRGA